MMQVLHSFFVITTSFLCGGMWIHADSVIPQDNLSSAKGEEVERDLLFLPQFSGRVDALELVDALSEVKLTNLTNGIVIISTDPSSFNIDAIVVGKRTRSVVFQVTNSNGTTTHMEDTVPFALCANKKTDFYPCNDLLGFGTHTLSVKACSKRNGQGRCTPPMEVTIQIQRPLTTAPVAPIATPPKAPAVPAAAPIAPKAPMDVPAATPVLPIAPLLAPRAPVEPPATVPVKAPIAPTKSPSESEAPSRKPSRSPSNKPSNAPSRAPTAINCTSSAISALSFLNCNTLTNRSLSLTGTTQEDKAAQWVVMIDSKQLKPDTEANRRSLLQRYALATMLQDGIGLSVGSECSWTGVTCNNDISKIVTTLSWNGDCSDVGDCFPALATALSKDLGLLRNLGYVDFKMQYVLGTIPSDLKAWTNIQFFDIRNNQLGGTIPAALKSWTKIKTLDLSKNNLAGRIPSELGAWTILQDFSANDNQLTGTIPSALKAWTQLQLFSVVENQFNGTIPGELAAWTNLFEFYGHKNKLTGIIPASFAAWTKLEATYLYCNNFTDPQDISFVCLPTIPPFVLVNGGLTCSCCDQYRDSCL